MATRTFPDGRGFILLDGDALCRNFCLLREAARRHAPSTRPIAVVKANAYGHGVEEVVPLLTAVGCDFFAVATPEEGLTVRTLAPAADILVLGYTPPQKGDALAENRLTQTVFSLDYAKALSAALSRPVAVHIKLDSRFARLGLDPEGIADIRALFALPRLCPTGLFTHFPTADTDPDATREALLRFLACKQALGRRGEGLFTHAAASAAALSLPESLLDGFRVGIALYGYPPVRTELPLSPVLSLHAPVVQVHHLPSGSPVGYGGAYITRRPSRIGTLPIGYGDGLFRAFSLPLRGMNGEIVPIVGRICMDMLMADLTDTALDVGDTLCLFDDAAEAARRLHTVPYEILTALSTRSERKRK